MYKKKAVDGKFKTCFLQFFSEGLYGCVFLNRNKLIASRNLPQTEATLVESRFLFSRATISKLDYYFMTGILARGVIPF